MKKVVHKHFFPWEYDKLEQALDDAADDGWRAVRVSRFRQEYERAEAPEELWIHRLDYNDARPGSAAEITRLTKLAEQGWQPVCRNGALCVFRRQVTQSGTEEFPGGRTGIAAFFRRRMRRQENCRMAALVAAALLLIVGYAMLTRTKALIYSAVVPLTVMLCNTLILREYEKFFPDEPEEK